MRFSRMWRAMVALVCVGALSLSATACAPTDAKPTPTPTKTAIFASEDEALQAAVDVYQQFNATYDAYLAGEKEQESLKPFLTESFWDEYSSEDSLSSSGLHTVGVSSFFNATVTTYDAKGAKVNLTLALCRDVSEVRVFDKADKDVTPDDRSSLVPSAANMTWSEDHKDLLITKLGSWDDSDICSQP